MALYVEIRQQGLEESLLISQLILVQYKETFSIIYTCLKIYETILIVMVSCFIGGFQVGVEGSGRENNHLSEM